MGSSQHPHLVNDEEILHFYVVCSKGEAQIFNTCCQCCLFQWKKIRHVCLLKIRSAHLAAPKSCLQELPLSLIWMVDTPSLMMGGPIELLLETILNQFSPLFNQPPQITCNYLSCTLKTSGFIHSNFRCITDSMSLQFWQAVTEELFLSSQHGVNVTPHTPITNLYMFLFPSSSVQRYKFFGKAFFNILLEGDFNHETLPLFRSTR